jgi:hypothetical protein
MPNANTENHTHPTNKWRNQRNASLRACHSLSKPKQQSQVTPYPIISLQFPRSLNPFPSRCDLYQDPLLLDPNGFVQGDKLFSFALRSHFVERQTGIDFGRNSSWNYGQNFFAEFDEL